MTDVIFNGTATRKPLGYAEVALTFDNTDGSLPIDFTDVVIGRRLYRDGVSEYFVNKQNCRLRSDTIPAGCRGTWGSRPSLSLAPLSPVVSGDLSRRTF